MRDWYIVPHDPVLYKEQNSNYTIPSLLHIYPSF